MGIIQLKINVKLEFIGFLVIELMQGGMVFSLLKDLVQKDIIGGSRILIKNREKVLFLLYIKKVIKLMFDKVVVIKNFENLKKQFGFILILVVLIGVVLFKLVILIKERFLFFESDYVKLKNNVFGKDNDVKNNWERKKLKINFIK